MCIIFNRIIHIIILCIVFAISELVMLRFFDTETTFMFFMFIPLTAKLLLSLGLVTGHWNDGQHGSYLDKYLDWLPFSLHKIFQRDRTVYDYYLTEKRMIDHGEMERHSRYLRITEKVNRVSPWLIVALIFFVINYLAYVNAFDKRVLENYNEKEYFQEFLGE